MDGEIPLESRDRLVAWGSESDDGRKTVETWWGVVYEGGACRGNLTESGVLLLVHRGIGKREYWLTRLEQYGGEWIELEVGGWVRRARGPARWL